MKPRPLTLDRAQAHVCKLRSAPQCERVRRFAERAASRTRAGDAPVWRSLAHLCLRRKLELQEAYADAF